MHIGFESDRLTVDSETSIRRQNMSERITNMSARLDEMGQGRLSLRIEAHRDGDVLLAIDFDGIPIQDEHGNEACVEFCSTAGGGGRSPQTRKALFELLKAMKQDAEHDPSGVPRYPIYLAEYMKKK